MKSTFLFILYGVLRSGVIILGVFFEEGCLGKNYLLTEVVFGRESIFLFGFFSSFEALMVRSPVSNLVQWRKRGTEYII